MFDTVLIANRGEIALRILRACRKLGLRVVAAYSEADRDAAYVALADEAVCIGPAQAAASYRNSAAILSAALATGAGAIHPGYGFLAENAAFAEQVTVAGLVFIGPPVGAIRTMGDKIAAKAAMIAAEVPCVPGSLGRLPDDPAAVARIADEIGYPVIVKAAGGGGGRGMRIVRQSSELADAVGLTRQEAAQAFGNPELYLERFLEKPRHVEIQVLCDNYGAALWLGARDCSLQRRHQKVVEEAPPPGISPAAIAEIGAKCTQACKRIGYRGAGTFEFLYEDGLFAFIEMNTRLQVEHPVTEMTTGIDIVAEQLRIAQGHALAFAQADILAAGHAIEVRVNAEDPETFAASPGRVAQWLPPGGPGIRVDSHLHVGARVSPHYDSLVAKIVSHGATRGEALRRLRQALAETKLEGISSNLPMLRWVLDDAIVSNGGFDIHHLERLLADRRHG
ncbi:MAG: acetyl-CoA carboxylase biotin carboxylase subunit [Telmatospirillum sp.]|nr:acetyl-CoA carboxylase biotin carboxylase subunit [Telmatospirillum sp.]